MNCCVYAILPAWYSGVPSGHLQTDRHTGRQVGKKREKQSEIGTKKEPKRSRGREREGGGREREGGGRESDNRALRKVERLEGGPRE